MVVVMDLAGDCLKTSLQQAEDAERVDKSVYDWAWNGYVSQDTNKVADQNKKSTKAY